MKKIVITLALLAVFITPSITHASTLTEPQVNAIVSLLRAFGVDEPTLFIVYAELHVSTSTAVQVVSPQTPPTTDVIPSDITTAPITPPVQIYIFPIQTPPPPPPVAEPKPLIIPTCRLSASIVPASLAHTSFIVYFSFEINPNAKGFLLGYGNLPTYTTYVQHPPTISILQLTPIVTYTLTETMTDPAYQTTTTCSTTADSANIPT